MREASKRARLAEKPALYWRCDCGEAWASSVEKCPDCLDESLVDDAFYCSRCGQPINRNSDGSDKPNSGGMCGVCASTGTVIA